MVGGNFDSAEIDDELFQNAPAINPSLVSQNANRGIGDYNQYRINIPQRIEPPKDLNTPARNENAAPKSADDDENGSKQETTADSPDATASLGKNLGALSMNKKQASAKNYSRSCTDLSQESRREWQASVTRMKDQEMLAFACRRANKGRNEGLAYYNMGV